MGCFASCALQAWSELPSATVYIKAHRPAATATACVPMRPPLIPLATRCANNAIDFRSDQGRGPFLQVGGNASESVRVRGRMLFGHGGHWRVGLGCAGGAEHRDGRIR